MHHHGIAQAEIQLEYWNTQGSYGTGPVPCASEESCAAAAEAEQANGTCEGRHSLDPSCIK